MSSSDNENPKQENIAFGQGLLAARKAQKLSIEEVAELLKVQVQVIEAIEASDVSQLPPATFTRGYLRAYARFVEIPDEAIIASFDRAIPQSDHLKPRSNLPDETSSKSPAIRTVTIIMIILGILAVIYGGYTYYDEKASSVKASMKTSSGHEDVEVGSLDKPRLKPLPVKQNAHLTQQGELVLDKDVAVTQETNGETETREQPEITLARQEKADRKQVVTDNVDTGADTISLMAKKGAWVEIKDSTGKRLHYNLVPKGKWMQYTGKAPFDVSMGNARSTVVKVNGVKVDMSAYIRPNNIAHYRVSTRERDGQQVVVFH